MKKKSKVFALVVAIACMFSVAVFTGCSDNSSEKTGVAYGAANGGHVAFSTVTRKGNVVTSVKIDEAYNPEDWAVKGADETIADTISKGSIVLAKYISINGVVYTGSVANDAKNTVTYMAGDKDCEEAILGGKEEYIKGIEDGKVFVCGSDGVKIADRGANKCFKKLNGYWPAEADKFLGWKDNMDKLEKALVANGFSGTPTRDKDGNCMLGTVDTGATVASFVEYVNVAKDAYNKAK